MNRLVRAAVLAAALITAGFLVLMLASMLLMLFGDSAFETAGHLLGGWFLFLTRNLPAVLRDPGVLLSGAVATMAALTLTHFLARTFFGGQWKWRASFAVIGFLFTGFAAAFLVPGAIFIVRTPMEAPWTTRTSGSERAWRMMHVRNLSQALLMHVGDNNLDHYPASLGEVTQSDDFFAGDSELIHAEDHGYLYLGAGVPLAGPATAILVSPPFMTQGTEKIAVGYSDGAVKLLLATEIDAVLKAAEARLRAQK
jgi:hypothetical protein